MKAFNRWAGQLGFEYHVIEGFWPRWSAEQLRELIADARCQGVGLFLWKHSKQLAGHGDYTRVHFGARRGDTTWAHQIATAAVFDEPLLTYAAHRTNLLANPAIALIRSIPPVWDQTSALEPSEIGEVAVFARREGSRWFLAVLNGPRAGRIQVPLSFLEPKLFEAMLVRDRSNEPAALAIQRRSARRPDSWTIELERGGGFIASFAPR